MAPGRLPDDRRRREPHRPRAARRAGRERAGTGSADSGTSTNKLVQWGGRITTNSYQYSADIIAVSSDGRAFKRVRIIVDTRETPARIVYRKDLTSNGWPLPQDVLDQLRSGNGLQTTLSSTGRTSSGTR